MVEFKSKPFIYTLAAIQYLSLAGSLYSLLTGGGLVFLVGIILSGLLLYLIHTKDEYVILCTKVWAGIVILAGAAGLVSSGCAYVHVASGGSDLGPESYSLWHFLRSLVILGLGIFYMLGASRFIVPSPEKEETQTNFS